MSTKITLMRKDSKGLDGSIENAVHHAPIILPFIYELKDVVGKIGFKKWIQGNNVHEFVTDDDRRFTLRAYVRDGEYKGIRLSLRLSRTEEVRLADVHNVKEVGMLISAMMLLAGPEMGIIKALSGSKTA